MKDLKIQYRLSHLINSGKLSTQEVSEFANSKLVNKEFMEGVQDWLQVNNKYEIDQKIQDQF